MSAGDIFTESMQLGAVLLGAWNPKTTKEFGARYDIPELLDDVNGLRWQQIRHTLVDRGQKYELIGFRTEDARCEQGN